jgi:hypothetical protein
VCMSDYLKKKMISEKLFSGTQARAKGEVIETVPEEITAQIRQLAAQIKPEGELCYIPVVEDKYGLFGYCADGVLEKISHDGGSIRFGWMIWEWPEVLLTAEFHAVWVSPTGELVDITPKPTGESRILFIPDECYSPDFDFKKRPVNRRFNMSEPSGRQSLLVEELIAVCSEVERLLDSAQVPGESYTIVDEVLANAGHRREQLIQQVRSFGVKNRSI